MVEASSIMFYNVYVVNHSNIIWVIFCFVLHQPEDLEIETPDANNHFKQHHCIRMLIKHGSFTSEFHHVSPAASQTLSFWASKSRNDSRAARHLAARTSGFPGADGRLSHIGKKNPGHEEHMEITWKPTKYRIAVVLESNVLRF